ncbi:MAG: SpoIIE family protein phosphatase [Bdellovibrionaceae bacterium]|nr:SpoIIE family protein phosphatase [Bdellovibrionales bacterium]MCB9082833.1 SpoIIE family protein phosphatase [Pseudobdellovibrionaceae bacterium]
MASIKYFSLRYKLLALLILMPTAGLALYALMAINLFTKDKKAYIFDSSVIVSKALATQVKIELDAHEKLMDPIVKSIDTGAMKFSKLSYEFFIRQNRVEHLFLFKHMGNGRYAKADQLYLENRSIKNYDPGGEVFDLMLKTAGEVGFAVQDVAEAKRFFLIAQKYGDEQKHVVVLSLYNAPDLYEAFATPSAYRQYLVSRNNFISMEPKYMRKTKSKAQVTTTEFFTPIFNNRFPVGIAEIKTKDGHPMLVSFSKVGKGGLFVASLVEKAAALKAIDTLIVESLLFVLSLISVTIIIGVIASFGLTSALSRLVEATKEIAGGNFDVKIDVKSKDEVSLLGDSISFMAGEVSRLMNETAEKARLVNELETVKLIQETLFPPDQATLGPLDIVGYFHPASEAGGDWYHYSMMGEDRAFIWIGDVTGHGAPAAMVTAAAKAVSSIVEEMEDVTPAMALKVMNHAINATAKGNTLMTFFLMSVDFTSGKVVYANASHEPPYVLPVSDKLKKKDFVPLCDSEGSRLGEKAGAEYKDVEYQLNPGDTVLLYTDGVIDLANPAGEGLGERQFIKLICDNFSGKAAVKTKFENLKKTLNSHQQNAPLVDDVTLFAFQFKA